MLARRDIVVMITIVFKNGGGRGREGGRNIVSRDETKCLVSCMLYCDNDSSKVRGSALHMFGLGFSWDNEFISQLKTRI